MRTNWERRTRPRGKVDVVYALQFWSTLWVLVLGLLPVLFVMSMGAAQGTATRGLFFAAGNYPAYTTFSAGLLLPAIGLLVASIMAIPLPLEDVRGARRSDMAWLSVFAIALTLVSLVLDEGRAAWLHLAPYAAIGMFALVIVVVALRGLLGAMKLLPRSWRGTYRASYPNSDPNSDADVE